MIKCPYSELDMTIALNNIDNECSEERMEEIGNDILGFTVSLGLGPNATTGDMNKAVAKENGIEVIDLINSPNMEFMVDEFRSDLTNKIIKRLKETHGFTDKQSWAILYFGQKA